jgi:putative Ca2+/H+ antiporter (TMEM165/GDT1 family)
MADAGCGAGMDTLAAMADALIPMAVVGLAELGDKTQLSIFLLSSRTEGRLRLLLGTVLAFAIVDGIAVAFASCIANVTSITWLKIGSGAVFLALGILMLRKSIKSRDGEAMEGGKSHFEDPFLSGFVLIFMTEWGDKTQISSAAFAARYNASMVFIGTMAALTISSIAAIYLGRLISRMVDRALMEGIAGIAFIAIGASMAFL